LTRSELLNELPETTFTFLNQPAKISKRSAIKPGQSYLYAFFPNKEKPFRGLSSLYFTPDADLLAFEYKKTYYALDVKTLTVIPDAAKRLWNSSKGISQHIVEGEA